MSEEGKQRITKAELVSILEQLLFDWLPIDKAVAASMIVAQHVTGRGE
jgi:hypothetical protein